MIRGLRARAGTLLMPALSYERVTEKNPPSTCCARPNVGAIPEAFRTRPGTRRSIHPRTPYAASGRTAELLNGHDRDTTPCGELRPSANSGLLVVRF